MTIEELKSKIDATINSNGKRLITGAQLNEVLNAIATYTAEVDGNSLKIPQFLPFDSIIANADVQVGSTSATDYKIVYVESKNVFTAYTGGVYYSDWVGSSSYNKGTFSKTAIATNLYINPYAEIYKIENNKLIAIQNNVLQESVLLLSEQSLTSAQKIQVLKNIGAIGAITANKESNSYSGILSYLNMPYYPQTKATKVSFGGGGNVEDKIKEINELSTETKEGFDTFMNGTKVQVTQILDSIAKINRDLLDEVTRAKQTEMYLESQKADKSGYYENLSVGIADNLSGRGEATESEFAMRPSGGANKSIQDGTARINTIKGNSVVLNQQADNTKWEAQYSESFVNDGGIFIVKGTPPSDGSGYYLGIKQQHNNLLRPSVGDIILLICDYYPIGTTSFGYNYSGYSQIVYNLKENDWNNISSIFTVTNQNTSLTFDIILFGVSKAKELRFKNIEVVNLTKMFCKGNEPTTVEEYKALYGNMPKEYNEGTIIDNHTSTIKSVGVNAWDEQWELGVFDNYGKKDPQTNAIRSKNTIPVLPSMQYYLSSPNNNYVFGWEYNEQGEYIGRVNNRNPISNNKFTTTSQTHYINIVVGYPAGGNIVTTYNHDICIHLAHTGYLNGKYFPYESQTRQLPTIDGGLKSAGTAYDEIRYNKSKDKWEYVKRIGSVDLGTLSWSKIGTEMPDVYRFISYGIQGTSVDGFNVLCVKYIGAETITGNDKTMQMASGGIIHICDHDYSNADADTFKQAMQGVILRYELAEPIVTELDVDISPDYKVWDYGTEEAISEVLSTPVRIKSDYGFNAVGQITDNTELIKELLARVAVLEAQIAQANSANTETIEPVVE